MSRRSPNPTSCAAFQACAHIGQGRLHAHASRRDQTIPLQARPPPARARDQLAPFIEGEACLARGPGMPGPYTGGGVCCRLFYGNGGGNMATLTSALDETAAAEFGAGLRG